MFDLQRFEQKLLRQIDGKATGYGYAIFQGETMVASGAAGYAVVATQKKMTADTRMTSTSMTKTITAASVLKAMEIMQSQGKAITVDSKIAPYLPTAWTYTQQGHVAEMTFRHLLIHSSGLRSVPDEDTFDSLGQTIANGSTDAHWQQKEYQNCNFSLCRVLVANMLYGVSVSAPRNVSALQAQVAALQAELQTAAPGEKAAIVAEIARLNKQIDAVPYPDLKTAQLYYDFVRAQIFAPIGLTDISLAPNGPAEAICYYDFSNPAVYVTDFPFMFYLLRVGAGHWFLSPVLYGRFIAALRAGKIVSPACFQAMTDGELGMYMDASTIDGASWSHNGGFTNGNAGQGGEWVMLPNGLSAVVMMNSAGGMHKAIGGAIKNAYDATCAVPPLTSLPIGAASVNGRISVFMAGKEDHIFSNSANDGSAFEGWAEVEGGGTSQAALAAASCQGQYYLFARGTLDQKIYYNHATGNQPFTWWQEVEGGGHTDVALSAAGIGNRMYVFAKGIIDERVYVNVSQAGAPFGGWSEVQGGMVTNTALGSAPLGSRIYVFAKGLDNQIYVNSAIAGQPFDGWGSGWVLLPGCKSDMAPTAATVGNRIYVFVKGLDNHVYRNTALDSQAFEGWAAVEGGATTDVAPGSASMGGRVYVFAKGVNDKRVYANSAIAGKPFDGWGNGWSELTW